MLGWVSTWMGDRLGTPGAVVFLQIPAKRTGFQNYCQQLSASLLKYFDASSRIFNHLPGPNGPQLALDSPHTLDNGHTMLKTPVLVRSLKLSNIGLG